MNRMLGLLQSRGIGDIIIALPIAKYFHDRGVSVYWPVDERLFPNFRDAVDYAHFIPFEFQPTLKGFIQEPLRLLKAVPCEQVVPLYNSLTKVGIANRAFHTSLKFDEYKYAIAGVPFAEKWNLSIRRNAAREKDLFDRVVEKEDYVVVHQQGSNAQRRVEVPERFQQMQRIEIDERTDCVFDWLMVLERARFLLLIDSCFSNLVEQLGLKGEKQFILRSDVRFTPVLRGVWGFYGESCPVQAWLNST
jgi:hypothetical protein